MFEDPELVDGIVKTVQNHLDRAEEGRRLLAEGRSLSEMKTPITGLTHDQTIQRRQAFLESVKEMDDERLLRRHLIAVTMILKRLQEPDVGTSELEWQRIIFEMEIHERGLNING